VHINYYIEHCANMTYVLKEMYKIVWFVCKKQSVVIA